MLSAAYASFPQEGRQTRMQLLSEGLKSLPPTTDPLAPACRITGTPPPKGGSFLDEHGRSRSA